MRPAHSQPIHPLARDEVNDLVTATERAPAQDLAATQPSVPRAPAPRTPRRRPGSPSLFWRHFEQACAARGIEPYEVADRGGFSRSTITNWRHGTVPSDEYCALIAQVLVLPTKLIPMLWADIITEHDLALVTDPHTGALSFMLSDASEPSERLLVPASEADDEAVSRAITAVARLPWSEEIKWGLIAQIEEQAAATRALRGAKAQHAARTPNARAAKADTPREGRPRRRWHR